MSWNPTGESGDALSRRLAGPKSDDAFRASGLSALDWGGRCAAGPLANLPCFPADYKRLFEQGVGQYLEGSWASAKAVLETCRALCPKDETASILLRHMQAACVGASLTAAGAPVDWRRFRELTDK